MRPSCGRRRSAIFRLRHQLDARNNRGLQLARRRVLIHQHAVDAVADAEFFFERLDVNVAGALFDGLRDHGVHQADDRRLARHVAKVFQIFVGFARRRRPSSVSFFCGLAVVAVDRVEDFLLRREPRLTVSRCRTADRRARLEIQRIGHGQRDRVIVQRHGKAAELAQESGESVSVSGETAGGPSMRQQRNLQLLGQRRQHVAHGDEAQVDQDLAQLLAALLLQFERAVEILRGDQLPLDQDLAKRMNVSRAARPW